MNFFKSGCRQSYIPGSRCDVLAVASNCTCRSINASKCCCLQPIVARGSHNAFFRSLPRLLVSSFEYVKQGRYTVLEKTFGITHPCKAAHILKKFPCFLRLSFLLRDFVVLEIRGHTLRFDNITTPLYIFSKEHEFWKDFDPVVGLAGAEETS